MDFVSLAFAVAFSSPPKREEIDFDAPMNAARVELDSPYLRDMMTAAMALPFGVTRMPCNAWQLQPTRGWKPAREPSGRIAWVIGPETSVRWTGIYGTCFIQSPRPRQEISEIERTALECECNGWLPKGISEYPQP